MVQYLGDVNARARGLRTRLLPESELERLAHSANLSSLQKDLAGLGYMPADTPAMAGSMDRAIRRHSARDMAVLDRWCGDDRRATLAVLFSDEDRRSVQAILRGAAQGTSSDVRMSGLIPTVTLPERALQALSSQPTPVDVVRLLVLWDHPFGSALIEPAKSPHPSLFDMEIALQRAFARMATAHARGGGPQLVEYVRQVIDLMNAWSALLHFVERGPSIAELTFVEGGAWFTRGVFLKLMGVESMAQLEAQLVWELRKSPLANALRGGVEDLAGLEGKALRAQIDSQNRAMRIDPGGAAPIIGFAVELRAEVLNLRNIVWGVALRAPAALIQAELVVT